MRIVGVDRAYEDLANAIIVSAVQDYKRELIRLKRNPGNKIAKKAVRAEEDFFYSPWFEMLTNLHPDYLICKIKENIIEEEKECI